VAGDGLADLQVLVSPAIDPNGGSDWVVKLDSVAEVRRVKIGFQTASGGYSFGGCADQGCTLDPALVGPTVDTNPLLSHIQYDPFARILYVVLEGNLDAETVLGVGGTGDNTLLNVPNYPAPSRVTLGVLSVPPPPPEEPPVPPAFALDQVDLVDPPGPPFVIPGPDGDAYAYPVDLTGTGEISEDADADLISNDTDNCPVYANFSQLDRGGLEAAGESPPFDGVGDACQCGDALGDGRVTPPTEKTNPTDGDVLELQWVLAGKWESLNEDPQVAAAMAQAALERCSVSGEATAGGGPSDCDIKDLVTLALAIANQGPGISAVCERNMPGQASDP